MGDNLMARNIWQTADKLMAICIQQMRVDPRAEIVPSQLPGPIGTRWRTSDARTSNNQVRSTSGNRYRLLGGGSYERHNK